MTSIALTAAELAQIRADIADLLPDTCNILQLTRTSDNAGGWSEAWGTATGGTAVPCRLDFTQPGRESVASASLTPFKSGMVSMAYDKTVTTANRVEIASTQYNITGVNDNQSWIGVKRVSVERIP
jgi:head-tail adaptor